MNAEELAHKFRDRSPLLLLRKKKQRGIASENADKRAADVEHCKNALEREVIPFLSELKHHLGDDQFSFAPQIELKDHRPVGVSFTIGNGAPTSITTAFGTSSLLVSAIAEQPRARLMFTHRMSNPTFRIRVISHVIRLPSCLRW